MNEIAASIGALVREDRETETADRLYGVCAAEFGPALERLAAAYEAEVEVRRDLLQEIHTALWRSLHAFDRRCSLRTWMYRVAHNTAASHVAKSLRRRRIEWTSLDDVGDLPADEHAEKAIERRLALDRLLELVQKLRPLDKQVFLLYLEGLDGRAIAEITGISAGFAATKIHRIKEILTTRFHGGGTSDAAQ